MRLQSQRKRVPFREVVATVSAYLQSTESDTVTAKCSS